MAYTFAKYLRPVVSTVVTNVIVTATIIIYLTKATATEVVSIVCVSYDVAMFFFNIAVV